MKKIQVWLASPRAGGVTDTLARQFIVGAEASGAIVGVEALRRYAIAPCTGCGACTSPPHACRLSSGNDATERLFGLLQDADINVFASPIYFYALPANFKAFIDRSQRFWASGKHGRQGSRATRPALAILAAARPRGRLLFSGALRTLSWFLKTFDTALAEKITLRGLESVDDLRQNPEYLNRLCQLGAKWGKEREIFQDSDSLSRQL